MDRRALPVRDPTSALWRASRAGRQWWAFLCPPSVVVDGFTSA